MLFDKFKFVSLQNSKINKLKSYLKSAHLKGYRTVIDVSANFNDGLNVIIGQNGSGKTNFLTFLYDTIRNSYKPYSNLSSKLEFSGNPEFCVETITSLNESPTGLDNSLLKTNREFIVTTNKHEKKIFTKQEEFNDYLNEKSLKSFVQFIPHGIRKDNKIIDVPFSFVYKGKQAPDLIDAWIADSNSWLVRSLCLKIFIDGYSLSDDESVVKAKIIKATRDTLDQYLQNINESIKNYLPIEEVRISPTFRVFDDTNDESVKFEGLAFEYFFNGSWLPFSSLSDGTKRLFCIYADITADINLATGLKGHIKTNQIILLEEPELGIHPHQFHKIMLFLKNVSQESQIIITTHSPQALNIFSKEELGAINICTFDNESGTKISRLTSAELAKAKAFMDEMYLSDYWVNSTLDRI